MKRCVKEEDIACPKARAYLKKHGLICGINDPPRPKPTPATKKKSFFDEWFGS